MAIKHKGSGVFTYNLDIQAPKPFDSRLVVESYSADLAGENYKSTFVLGGANAWYDGMLVYAEDTKKVYVLKGEEGFVEVGQDLSDAELTDTTYSFESAKKDGVAVDSGAYFTVTEEGKTAVNIYVDADVAGTAQTLVAAEVIRADAAYDKKGDADAALAAAKEYADSLPHENTTYTFEEGTVNGEFVVTPSDGTPQQVKVHGLGSAAYTESSAYDEAGAAEAVKTDLVNGETEFADFKAVGDELRALDADKVTDVTVGGVSVVNTDHVAVLGTAAGKAIEDFDAAGAADAVKTAVIGDATTAGDTLGKLEDRIEAIVANEKTYSVVKMTAAEVSALGNSNVKEAYKLIDEDKAAVGDPILVYKDSSLKSAAMGTDSNAQKLMLTYILADGSESVVPVDLSAFYAESETGDGLQLIDHVISVKRDALSESFLTVGANGVKLSGVQDAIDAAEADANEYTDDKIAALNATVGNKTVAEGKHVAVEVVETAGKLTGLTIVESDIASAQDLSDLTTVVNENEQVTAAALNELNGRMVTAEGEIDDLQETIDGLDLGVKTVKGQGGEYVTVTPTEASKGDVTVSVSVSTTKATNPTYTNDALATDGYVEEQAAAAESNAKTYADNLMSWAVF